MAQRYQRDILACESGFWHWLVSTTSAWTIADEEGVHIDCVYVCEMRELESSSRRHEHDAVLSSTNREPNLMTNVL